MFKRIVGYSFLALFAYVSILIIELPAEVVWRFLQPHVPLEQASVRLSSVQGTLWNGASLVNYEGQQGRVEWRLQPWRQLVGGSPVQVKADTPAGQIALQLSMDWSGIVGVKAQGQVCLATFNEWLAGNQITLDGDILIESLVLSLDPAEGRVLDAQGALKWSGGTVAYPMGPVVQKQQMGGLIGLLSLRGEDVVLDVKDSPSQLGVAEILLQPDGIAKVAVRRKLLDLAGAPWAPNSSPQDVVFRVQQKIL